MDSRVAGRSSPNTSAASPAVTRVTTASTMNMVPAVTSANRASAQRPTRR
jgi:hypothetical protein